MHLVSTIFLFGLALSQLIQEGAGVSLKKGDEVLSYAERLPAEWDNRPQHAEVFLYKSAIVSNIANHWGLLLEFSDYFVLIEGIRQGRKLQSKYSKVDRIPAGQTFKLTQNVMQQNHDSLERAFGWLFSSHYQSRRRQLGDFPRGVTISPMQLRYIARTNPYDNNDYALERRDCQTWAIESAKSLARFKN